MSPAFGFGDDEQKTAAECQFLELLLNSEVDSLSFSTLPRTFNSSMKRVTSLWMEMTQKCPNLQKIVCDRRFGNFETNGLLLFYSFSLHFTGLQVLECRSIGCNDFRLGLLAENLPQLRFAVK
jgi:hypothetical protein